MNSKALEARRAYKREWAKRNRDKVRAQEERYWERKAEAAEQDAPQPAEDQTAEE